MSTTPGLDTYIAGISEFVTASPSSFHAAREVERQLIDAGFTSRDERAAWPELDEGSKAVGGRGGACIACVVDADTGQPARVNISGAHTGSPGFNLKPNPAFETEGWAQAGVEVYGGPLLNSWLDRDLEFACRLVT